MSKRELRKLGTSWWIIERATDKCYPLPSFAIAIRELPFAMPWWSRSLSELGVFGV